MIRPTLRALAVCLAAVVTLSACGSEGNAAQSSGSTLDSVVSDGEIVVGVSPVVEGISYKDPSSGKIVGMIPDIVEAYADTLGVKVKYKSLEWDTLIPSVNNGTIDVIAAHMTMTIPRTKNVTFTDPWFLDSARAVVRSDSKLEKLDDLNSPDVTIGSGQGSSYNELIPKLFPKANLKILPTTAWQDALKTGRIDAMFDDTVSFPGPMKRNKGAFKYLEGSYGANMYGFGVRLGDTVFQQSWNIFLKQLKVDGRYAAIYKKWIKKIGIPLRMPVPCR